MIESDDTFRRMVRVALRRMSRHVERERKAALGRRPAVKIQVLREVDLDG